MAMTSATAETMIEPTNKGWMPYQSCQKLAVIQSCPKRKALMPRYHGTGRAGSQFTSCS